MLKMHARCLKELHRRDEYIRMLLHLLAKSAGREKDFLFPKIQTPSIKPPSAEKLDDLGHQWLDDDHLDTRGILNELLTSSNDLPYDITVPMAKYFADITVEPYLRLYDHKDGFQLRLKFRHLLQDDLRIEKVRVRLIHTSIQGREIWLEGNEPVNLRHGPIRIWVHSNVSPYIPIAKYIITEDSRWSPLAFTLWIRSPSRPRRLHSNTNSPLKPGEQLDSASQLRNRLRHYRNLAHQKFIATLI